MRISSTLAVTAVALVVLTSACGGDDRTGSPTTGEDVRTVEVDMMDIAFEPNALEVRRGETVRFVFTNTGEIAHDAVLGDAEAQADHEAEMRQAEEEGHGGGHGEGAEDAITVDPGATGELTHTFDEEGSLEIGCHQPGHYDAGMRIDITIS